MNGWILDSDSRSRASCSCPWLWLFAHALPCPAPRRARLLRDLDIRSALSGTDDDHDVRFRNYIASLYRKRMNIPLILARHLL